MINTSKRLWATQGGVFTRSDEAKNAYRLSVEKQSSFPLIDLSIGSTDLAAPESLLNSIAEAIWQPSSSAYCLQAGTVPFQQAVSDWCKKRFDVSVDPKRQVQLLVGAQEGTAHLPMGVLDPGDRAMHLDPCYPSHLGGLQLAAAKILSLPLSPDMGWEPQVDSFAASIWDQLKLFVFGYPHNPTARVGDQDLIDKIMYLGCKHQLVIAHDNPYVDLALEGDAPSLIRSPGWSDCGIEFFSFSKGWCLGGFRIGFAVGAESVINALRNVKTVIGFNQSLALQQGAIKALTDYSDWPKKLHGIYRQRRDGVIKILTEGSWFIPTPDMALYLWMPLPHFVRSRGWTDEKFSTELLKLSGVALLPGSGFGKMGSNWLRLALVRPVEELELAAQRIINVLEKFV